MSTAAQYFNAALAWCLANPEIVVPLAVYVLWNVIPRTPPANRQLFALWALAERLMVLSWDRWGGKAKAIGVVSPSPYTWALEQAAKLAEKWAIEAPTKPDHTKQ